MLALKTANFSQKLSLETQQQIKNSQIQAVELCTCKKNDVLM